MDLYSILVQNKEIFKSFYALVILLVCFMIVLKSHRIYRVSLYEGIRHFRNAFLFYGVAFFSRYLLSFVIDEKATYFIFEFFVIMGGLSLLYSLIWKKFNSSHSSLANTKILVLYAFAMIVALFDLLTSSYYFLFVSQIIVFLAASIVSYKNYLKNGRMQGFPKFYVFAMLLSLLVWILNGIAVIFFEFNQEMIINTYILNMLFFLIFLFGIIKVSRS